MALAGWSPGMILSRSRITISTWLRTARLTLASPVSVAVREEVTSGGISSNRFGWFKLHLLRK